MWQLSPKLLPYYLLLSLFIWQITYLWWGSVNCFETIHHLSLMLTQSLLICTAPLIHSSNLLLNTYLVAGTLLFGTCHPLSSAPVRICPIRRVSQCVSVLCFTRVCVCVLVQVQAHGCWRLWGVHTSSLWSSRRSATWGQKGQDLVKNVVLVGTRSNMKLPGTPSYPLLAWRMVLWATTSAMATAKATMMLRTWW